MSIQTKSLQISGISVAVHTVYVAISNKKGALFVKIHTMQVVKQLASLHRSQ